MRSTSLLPSHTGPLWPRVVAPDRVQTVRQKEINSELMLNQIVSNKTVYLYKNGLGTKKPTLFDNVTRRTVEYLISI